MHAATFDAIEYLPTAHAVHVVAPALVPVLVMEPAVQPIQTPTLDAVEYLPAAHAVQVVAPAEEPVFVMEPGAHSEQYDLLASD